MIRAVVGIVRLQSLRYHTGVLRHLVQCEEAVEATSGISCLILFNAHVRGYADIPYEGGVSEMGTTVITGRQASSGRV